MLFVDTETYLKRLETCQECDKIIKLTMTCRVCTCFMVMKCMLVKNIDGKPIICEHPKGPKWLPYEEIKRKDTSSSSN